MDKKDQGSKFAFIPNAGGEHIGHIICYKPQNKYFIVSAKAVADARYVSKFYQLGEGFYLSYHNDYDAAMPTTIDRAAEWYHRHIVIAGDESKLTIDKQQ